MYPQPPQRYSQPMYMQPVYPPPSPKNTAMKNAAIILFVSGFGLKFIGLLLIAIFIGIIPLALGVVCDLIAFICLCLI